MYREINQPLIVIDLYVAKIILQIKVHAPSFLFPDQIKKTNKEMCLTKGNRKFDSARSYRIVTMVAMVMCEVESNIQRNWE